jgi:hypothetical protein
MSLLAAPVYAVLLSVDGFFGIDPRSGPAVNINAHIITFFLVGLPSALLVGLVCAFFLDARMPLGTSLLLSAAFGLGTLVFPWAGVLNVQSLLAFLFFLAWSCIRRRQYLWVASTAMGVAIFTDYIALPVVGMFVLWGICLVWRDWRSIGTLLLDQSLRCSASCWSSQWPAAASFPPVTLRKIRTSGMRVYFWEYSIGRTCVECTG